MEVDFDYGFKKVKVPKIFEDAFKEEKEINLKNEKDIEFWKNATFEDWLIERDTYNFYEYYGKIVDKEIADFLVAKECGTDFGQGGYPREEYMEFKENGFKYTIICFGWSNDDNMKSGGYNFIGYKEVNNESKKNS